MSSALATISHNIASSPSSTLATPPNSPRTVVTPPSAFHSVPSDTNFLDIVQQFHRAQQDCVFLTQYIQNLHAVLERNSSRIIGLESQLQENKHNLEMFQDTISVIGTENEEYSERIHFLQDRVQKDYAYIGELDGELGRLRGLLTQAHGFIIQLSSFALRLFRATPIRLFDGLQEVGFDIQAAAFNIKEKASMFQDEGLDHAVKKLFNAVESHNVLQQRTIAASLSISGRIHNDDPMVRFPER
ncbi:hypothetical protein MPER_12470 [Moniliophthora perniciosa FA553]|nr:hypothetical protein MPER_12470 [Moniliophthora perniciosa FA553]